MISLDPVKIKEQRVALDAHRYALPDSYIADQLREISMLLDLMYQELIDHNYVILETKKGGIDDKGGEARPNSKSST